jgi:hypothetical protein
VPERVERDAGLVVARESERRQQVQGLIADRLHTCDYRRHLIGVGKREFQVVHDRQPRRGDAAALRGLACREVLGEALAHVVHFRQRALPPILELGELLVGRHGGLSSAR